MNSSHVEDKNPKADRGLSTLHLVAKSDHLPIYQLICENALDINPIMEGGITPLHLAAQFGNFNVCKYICDNVGNVSPLRSYDLASPLTLAFHRGQIRIAKLLIENDMDNIWNILETVFCTFAMWLVLFLCVTLKVNWWSGDYEK